MTTKTRSRMNSDRRGLGRRLAALALCATAALAHARVIEAAEQEATPDARSILPPDPVAEDATPPDFEDIDWELAEVQRLIEEARFRVARRLADSTRRSLESIPGEASASRRANLEVFSATLELALGQKDAALERMRAALSADPELQLDATSTSPKVVAAFEAVRAEVEDLPSQPAEPAPR